MTAPGRPADRETPPEGGRRVCLLCRHLLNYVHGRWVHADLDADHEAVVGPLGEVETRPICDVCSAEQASTYLPAPNVTMPEFRGHSFGTSTEGWALCPLCARLWRRGRFDRLADRAIDTLTNARPLRPDERADLRRLLLDLYGRVGAVAGTMRPLTVEDLG